MSMKITASQKQDNSGRPASIGWDNLRSLQSSATGRTRHDIGLVVTGCWCSLGVGSSGIGRPSCWRKDARQYAPHQSMKGEVADDILAIFSLRKAVSGSDA